MALLRDCWTFIAIAVAVIAALALLIWLWWQVPKWQMQGRIFRGEKERADAEDNFRKTVGQALGGAAVLIGAGAAYLQFSQQQQTAYQQIITQQQVAENSRKTSQDLLISNQVSKGFELLGNDKTAVRLGGIYALESVMNNSPEYHQPVLEALCAFVRDSTVGTEIKRPATDIEAALTVIARRVAGRGEVELWGSQLANATLERADLRGFSLRNVNLKRARMIEADLGSANLYGSDLTEAALSGANLSGAYLAETNLANAWVNGANLTGAHLIGTNLTSANLSGSNLSGANLSYIGAIGTTITMTRDSGAILTGADLTGADLTKADLTGAILTGVHNLTQAQLDQACGKPAALPEGLTLDKPCHKLPVAPPLNPSGTP
jgi:uncharacterized protein YjbI with pentapeptide repeats